MDLEIKTPDRYFRATVPFAGKHHVYNIAAAVAAATVYGLDWREIDSGLSLLRTLPRRGQVLNIESVTIWDESYNSNPTAAEFLLDTIASFGGGFNRTILTLGDMLELGAETAKLHFELGTKVPEVDPDWLVTVGELSKQIQAGAIHAGFRPASCVHFETTEMAAEFVQEELRPGDLLIL